MKLIIPQSNKIDYESAILDYIREHPRGLTITDITDGTGFSRNTVSKYVGFLELKKKIFKKKIRAYKLYFVTENIFISKKTVSSYYKSILSSFKRRIPNSEDLFKKIGIDISESFQIDISSSIRNYLLEIKNQSKMEFLQTFGKLFGDFDIFQDTIELSDLKIDENNSKVIYRFENSELFDNLDDYIYHFYTITGFIEGTLNKRFNFGVICNIEGYRVSKDSQKSYIDISLEIKK